MSDVLRVLENEVQVMALLFMAAVYAVRLVWLFRFTSGRERTFPEGNERAGIAFSLLNIALPWAVESSRKKPALYVQFMIFHLGVAAAIAATLIIPYAPGAFEIKAVALAFQILLGAAFFVGMMRLVRRVKNPAMRLISSVDDYVSLLLLILYFASAILAVPNNYRQSEWPLLLFFGLTAVFLVYVPFSKIGHYLYYPFAHFFLGRSLGHRGVYPVERSRRGRRRDSGPEERLS
jgi:nitrate reductase gamma subunit